MKKIIAVLMAALMIFALAACGGKIPETIDYSAKSEGVMTYAQYAEAPLDSEVVVEVFVQNMQSWWKDQVSVYAADPDGGYFMYNMSCSQEDLAKLVPGAKIKVTGYKGEYAGEVEIMEATFEACETGSGYIAEPADATAWFGTDELVKHINEYISIKGAKFVSKSYKNSDDDPDIYADFEINGEKFSFCVENYLTGPDSETYKAVEALAEGDIVDLTGFNYWYNGPNMHITAVSK